MGRDKGTTPEVADDNEEAVDDLMDRFDEIQGIAHVVDRALYCEHGAEWDRARFAVRGIVRLADLAGGAAMALAERVAKRGRGVALARTRKRP